MSETSTHQLISAFPDEAQCLRYLEEIRWNGIVTSPFKPNSKIYFCSEGKYKCRDTGKYFNAKTGTMFHHSRISLQKWFMAIWLMAIEKKTITSVDMAKELGITQKSAWYMMQRIRENFNLKKTPTTRRPKITAVESKPQPMPNDRLNKLDWLNSLKR